MAKVYKRENDKKNCFKALFAHTFTNTLWPKTQQNNIKTKMDVNQRHKTRRKKNVQKKMKLFRCIKHEEQACDYEAKCLRSRQTIFSSSLFFSLYFSFCVRLNFYWKENFYILLNWCRIFLSQFFYSKTRISKKIVLPFTESTNTNV